jgi:hypothetical protein
MSAGGGMPGGAASGGVAGLGSGTEAFFRHNNSCIQLTHNVRLSQVNRKSAITKYSIDDNEASAAYDSNDENIYLSKYDMVMNSNELFNGEFGLTYIKCFRCEARLEYYSEDSLGGLIVACSTIVHRECSLAAPLILDMIVSIMRYILNIQRIFECYINNLIYFILYSPQNRMEEAVWLASEQ